MKSKGLKISAIESGSIAEKLNINPGDILLSINDIPMNDVIDYLYHSADNLINITILKQGGETKRYRIRKRYDKTLGISFDDTITTNPKRCQNHCIFCFVDQMPKGLRKSLYIKDDDYRLSFLDGNFITLTNLKTDEINRIIEYHLSPLYVSIHATDNDVRNYLLGRKRGDYDIINIIKILIKNNIKIHCQIVLCPGINDGSVLEKTLNDLYQFYPDIMSCAVVPVGLTKFREGLPEVRFYDQESSCRVLEMIFNWNDKLKKLIGTNFVFPSDEFFTISGTPVPESFYYEGYPQLENGIGMLRKFMDEAHSIRKENFEIKKRISVLTSLAAFQTINELINEFMGSTDKIMLKAIKNNFFGGNVDVAGLITATDIIEQLRGDINEDVIIIPASMLKADEDIFLDGMTLEELQSKLNRKIVKCDVNGEIFIKTLKKEAQNYE
ncbi:DUF512 domain-containing protein [Calorimonas adulescens]|uniref:DUF512 domain-containing protein n=1 Tax=Calorimonas adulescens TaxID=2606906 RepID=A0A5D8QBT9_9THEO|nr:DUF512 domain-containing protein [Calorimonas adulescens]TZE81972.1 DUF512 domain-containing protein [Calorimonas adulescens]